MIHALIDTSPASLTMFATGIAALLGSGLLGASALALMAVQRD